VKSTISFDGWTRCFVFLVGLLAPLAGVLLFGLAVGAGSLLVAGPALADTALFRVEQSWHNFPNPAVTTPGGAGKYQNYIQPYTDMGSKGAYLYPPATANVESGNPVGGAFTLPQGFIDVAYAGTLTPKTGRPGYTKMTHSVYYNGPGFFKKDNAHTGSTPSQILFPTTGGNSFPNYGTGQPITPTTTFDGLYDFSRAGSINVTPGPRRFGGTFRMFYKPEASWYQYIYYFTPALYKAYGEFGCLNNGVVCTPNNNKSNSGVGDLSTVYRGTRFLLNVQGSGTGGRLQSNTAKATTPTAPGRDVPTINGQGTPGGGGPASYITGMQQYLNTIHPWTTGTASVHNPGGSPFQITPKATGYDHSLGGADITVTHYDWNQQWNKSLSTLTTTTATYKQYMFGVGRVVSMVRPRLIHTYSTPLDPITDPITATRSIARMWAMKVYFVPEPSGMLLLGAGVAGLLGLSRMRRR
jgi:hypothetical protein